MEAVYEEECIDIGIGRRWASRVGDGNGCYQFSGTLNAR